MMAGEQVLLGLGSNIGARGEYISRALEMLAPMLGNMRVSTPMQTAALLPAGAPEEWDMPYLNLAVAGECALAPQALLAAVKRIEQALGRQARGHWGPREIDVDILAYGTQVVDAEELHIPHIQLLKRDFALLPLAEIAPEWEYPTGEHKGKTAQTLARELFPPHTKLVGILNLTPDSFSDGGKYMDMHAALAHAEQLVQAGAYVLDVGAESTRPGATPLSAEDEWARLAPVLPALCALPVPVSVDTRHTATARRALELGTAWINDVTGFADAEMIAAVKDAGCTLVAMHSLGIPADKQVALPADVDAVAEVAEWMVHTIARFMQAGIAKERVVLDPGIGFGKTAGQSLALVQQAWRLKGLGAPLLVGHSRKSFLSLMTNAPAADRDAATLEISKTLLQQRVDYLRVHDITSHTALLKGNA